MTLNSVIHLPYWQVAAVAWERLVGFIDQFFKIIQTTFIERAIEENKLSFRPRRIICCYPGELDKPPNNVSFYLKDND